MAVRYRTVTQSSRSYHLRSSPRGPSENHRRSEISSASPTTSRVRRSRVQKRRVESIEKDVITLAESDKCKSRPTDAVDESVLVRTEHGVHLPPVLPPISQTALEVEQDVLKRACAHLVSVEPRLKPLIEQHHCHMFSPSGLAEYCDPFQFLCQGIMAQQVSGAAANSIKKKFIDLFHANADDGHEGFPPAELVASKDVTFLRQAGLSGRKAEYIRSLAEKFASGELSSSQLLQASDVEIMETLTAVRGLGRWSVEMFACFALKRMDILSTGDLGVQRGMAAFLGRDVARLKGKGGGKWKYMSEQDMLDYSSKFAPYRTLFMWYMWRAEGVNIDAVEKA